MVQQLCSICGSDQLERELLTITQPDRFEQHVGITAENYQRFWVECQSCGAVTNVHDPENLAKLEALTTAYYEVDFQSSTIADKYRKVMALPPEKSDNAQRVQRIHTFMQDWLRRYFPSAAQPYRVLDIGAGTGVFLSRFLREPWEAVAIEPDPHASQHLRSLNAFTVLETKFPGDTKLENFTLCTLNKVLEHFKHPLQFLEQLKTVLHPEYGVIYIEVPDKLTLFHRAASDNILGALHYHLYDPKSLTALLERAGLVTMQVNRLFEPSGKISVIAFATLPSTLKTLAHFNQA